MSRTERKEKLYELERLVASGGSEDDINNLRKELNIHSDDSLSNKAIDFDVELYLKLKRQQKSKADIAKIMGISQASVYKYRKLNNL